MSASVIDRVNVVATGIFVVVAVEEALGEAEVEVDFDEDAGAGVDVLVALESSAMAEIGNSDNAMTVAKRARFMR